MCSSPHWQVGQSWFREKLSPANREQRLSRWADFAKNCLPRIGSKVLPRFREKYRALGRQKNGVQHATAIYPIPRYTRPRYIGLTLYYVLFSHMLMGLLCAELLHSLKCSYFLLEWNNDQHNHWRAWSHSITWSLINLLAHGNIICVIIELGQHWFR